MAPLSRLLIYPLCLVAGSLLVVAAGIAHPDLSGDGAAQLVAIAHCAGWRAIHWGFLFSFPLSLTGLVGLVDRHAGTPGEGAGRAGLIVGAFAYGAWLLTVAFMGGAGWALARSYATADPGLAATYAVSLYDTLRPFALAAQRAAAFALGIATYLFGRGVLNGKVLPRWLGAAGVAAGLAGIALALGFEEDTKADQAAYVLPVLWQVVTGVVLLARRG